MIPAYRARPGHTRAVIAVVGENRGVEVSDLLVPFAILSRASSLDVSAVTLGPGQLSTFTNLGRPGFRIATDTTVAQFDAIHPEGVDYIIVPVQASTPPLIAWLKRLPPRDDDRHHLQRRPCRRADGDVRWAARHSALVDRRDAESSTPRYAGCRIDVMLPMETGCRPRA